MKERSRLTYFSEGLDLIPSFMLTQTDAVQTFIPNVNVTENFRSLTWTELQSTVFFKVCCLVGLMLGFEFTLC